MPRPCQQMHADPAPLTCPLCARLADPDPKWDGYRARYGGAATPATPATPAAPAKPRLSISELAAKRGRCKKLKEAGLPCDEFPPQAPAGKAVVVPQPPWLCLAPRHDRAVVTVAVGAEARALLAVSGPYMAAYAATHAADFVVLNWPGHPDWPMSCKFAIPRALGHYSRIAYVDADVLLRPGCIDLFAACAPDEFGFVDELQHHRQRPQFRREARYQQLRRDLGFDGVEYLPFMFNAGVMVVPKRYAPLLLPPLTPIAASHCAEQDHTNAAVLDAFLAGRTKVRMMDRRCNWQDWTDPGFASAPPDAVLHFSGSGGIRQRRADAMRDRAALTPLPLPAATHPLLGGGALG